MRLVPTSLDRDGFDVRKMARRPVRRLHVFLWNEVLRTICGAGTLIRTMLGVVADAPERVLESFFAKLVAVLCRMPEAQRDYHARCMLEGFQVLPPEKALAMHGKMMMGFLAQRPEEGAALMRSTDNVMFGSESRSFRTKRQAMG